MEDTLVVQFIGNAGPMTGTATVRMLLADGTIKVDYYTVLPSVINNFYSYAVIPPVEGYLLSCIVELNNAIDGSVWCTMTAFKGTVPQPIVSLPPVSGMLVVQGYVDEWTWLAWPNSPAVEAGMGAGRVRNITPATSNGVNWIVKTTSAQRWEVLYVEAWLTTSAAATPRQFSLITLDRLGNGLMRWPTNFTQAASLTYRYYFSNGAAHLNTGNNWITAPLSTGILLDPGMSMGASTGNLDAGDAWSFVSVTVLEWMGVGHS